ncbi:MAG: hypothetical protein V1702_04760 [Candidatus Woesearchaeota archaeon]
MRGLKLAAVLLAILMTFVVFAPLSLAAEPNTIVSNSADWKDVYSVMLFASLTQRQATFLVSDRHALLLPEYLTPDTHIWVISSPNNEFTIGYDSYLRTRGFTTEGFEYDNVNLELAKQTDMKNFIIVDDSYGYNSVAVAPYAVVSKSYVLFADSTNIDQIDSFLTDRNPDKVLIYGHVDRTVKDALAKYSPEIINKDGDRFANNVEILKKYQDIAHAKQVILTNGEFIEQEIMSGKEPVIFIGRTNVPDVTREYIQGSDISVGVLIGNELVSTATFVRRELGISVFVKFARSARNPAGSISQVEALDMFYLPTYSVEIVIDSVSYNKATRQLEIVFRNTKDVAAYFKGTYTITNADGTRQTVGDAEPIFIEPNSYKTVTYVVDGFTENSVIDAYVIYGESKNSLENVIQEQFCMACSKKFSMIDVIDNCQLNLTSVSYNLPRKLFYAEIENIGPVGCYLDIELVDVMVAAERVTYHLTDVAYVDAGQSKELRIKGALEQDDIQDNQFVNAKVYYGQRQNGLVKILEGRFPLLIITQAFSAMTIISYALLAVIIIILALLLWLFFAKRRRKRKSYDNQ